jgi:hypothetical protein
MAKQLAEKVSRLIDDFRTIDEVVKLIEHEMEKRIVARHALIKIDALLALLPQLKNSVKNMSYGGDKKPVLKLDTMIKRLEQDYAKSEMKVGRDALAAHSLQLDLERIAATWKFLGQSIFAILRSDLDEIDAELARLSLLYSPSAPPTLDSSLALKWRSENRLGDPARPRFAVIYPGIATAGIVAPIFTKAKTQENLIRAIGLVTFLCQVRILIDDVTLGSTLERLFAEIMLNDCLALWELLFTSSVRNDYNATDLSVLDHWVQEKWGGANCLSQLKSGVHPDIGIWRRDLRNKYTAHVDADADIFLGDVKSWPVSVDDLIVEAGRVVEAFWTCAQHDIRSKTIFCRVTPFSSDVVGLSGQEGKHWNDS